MNNPIRCILFRWYWVIALAGAVIGFSLLFGAGAEKRWELSATLIGVCAGVVYFVQKQKLEETQLFDRLFTRFNERYAGLHARLQAIRTIPPESLLSPEQLSTLDQYFNLCAEEYLFYTEGRIPRRVWRSWCRGMEDYLRYPGFESFWQQQVCTDSHYGLTRDVIQHGAR